VVCSYKGQAEALAEELKKVQEVCTSKWSHSLVALDVPHLDAERMLCLLKKN